MSPETADVVRQWMVSGVSLLFWLTMGTTLLLRVGFEIGDIRTYRRWEKNLRAEAEDITDGRARRLHKTLACRAVLECDESDRARLAYDLVLSRHATLRRTKFILLASAASFSTMAFVLTIRRLPLDDAGQLILPFAAAAIGMIIGEAIVIALVARVMPRLRRPLVVAAESVSEMLEADSRQASTRFVRLTSRARTWKLVEEAFGKAGIPTSSVTCSDVNFDSKEEWKKTKKSVVTRLARAYSGDYVGSTTEQFSRPPLGLAKVAAPLTGLAGIFTVVLQVIDTLRGSI